MAGLILLRYGSPGSGGYASSEQRLGEPAPAVGRAATEQTRRLLIASYVVLQMHQVNKRGQCRYCWHRAWWPWHRKPCTVYLTFKMAMTQPIKFVLGWMEEH